MDNMNEQSGHQEGGSPAPPPAQPFAQASEAKAEDFGAIFGRATSLWTGNIGSLIVVSLVFLLVCWIPIANFAFIAGYIRAILKVARGGTAEVGDIFGAWDCFVQILIYILIIAVVALINLIPILGTLVYLVFAFLVYPGMFKVIDQNAPAIESMKWSIGAFKAAIGNWLLAIIVGSILMSLGGIVIGIGMIVTMAWGYLLMALQYESQKDMTF